MLDKLLEKLQEKGYLLFENLRDKNSFVIRKDKLLKIVYIELNQIEYKKAHQYIDFDYVAMYFLDTKMYCWFNLKTNKMSSEIDKNNHDDFKFLFQLHKELKNKPSREELSKLLWEKPISQICKLYNVSDNAVIKWCKKFKLTKPPKGYWIKKENNVF